MPTIIYSSSELTSNQLKWKRHYDKLCERGQTRATTRQEAKLVLETKVERHHIIPECWFVNRKRKGPKGWIEGDPDDLNNLVFLSYREHFIAHQLLLKIYPRGKGVAHACRMMSVDKRGNRVTNYLYDWLKKKAAEEHSILMRGRTKETDAGVRRSAEKQRGRSKHTHAGYRSSSEKQTGRTKNTHTGVAKMSKTLTGRTKETHHGIAAQAKAMQGRTKENNEGVKKSAEKRMGRTKHNCEYMQIAVEKRYTLSKEHRNLLIEMMKAGMTAKMIVSYFATLNIKISSAMPVRHYKEYLASGSNLAI